VPHESSEPYAKLRRVAEVYANLGMPWDEPSQTHANLGWAWRGEGTQRLPKSPELPKLVIENRNRTTESSAITLIGLGIAWDPLGPPGITSCNSFGILVERWGGG
jgi:hypothetical protein